MIVKGIMIDTIAEIKQKDKHGWQSGVYHEIRYLQADKRGDVGERFIVKLLKEMGIKNVKHTSATDPENKHWDITADGITIEVKTATIGMSKSTFQHENLEKNRGCDMYIFCDITPNDVYITCLAKQEMNWKDMHHRRTGIAYKLDFPLNKIEDNKVVSLADFKRLYEKAAKDVLKHKRARRKPEDI